MHEAVPMAGCALGAYALGAIPFGFLIARLRGVDIRRVGSGNIGATNVFRCVGKSWGILAFAGDALKGFAASFGLPLLVAAWVPPDHRPALGILCACLAVAGHNWPVYLRFKGGKGVATTAGALLGIAPAAVGIGFAAWVIIFVTTRYVSVASVLSCAIIPACAWIMLRDEGILLPVALTILGGLAVWRHKGNIQRLLAGTEHRFSFGKKK